MIKFKIQLPTTDNTRVFSFSILLSFNNRKELDKITSSYYPTDFKPLRSWHVSKLHSLGNRAAAAAAAAPPSSLSVFGAPKLYGASSNAESTQKSDSLRVDILVQADPTYTWLHRHCIAFLDPADPSSTEESSQTRSACTSALSPPPPENAALRCFPSSISIFRSPQFRAPARRTSRWWRWLVSVCCEICCKTTCRLGY
jgi:hypothetical protein